MAVRLTDDTKATLAGIACALAATVDETQLVGWLEQGTRLGVILPEGSGDAAGAGHELEQRLWQQLTKELGALARERVQIVTRVHDGSKAPGGESGDADHGVVDASGWWIDASKRALDIAGSLAMLALISPLLLVLAALVKVTSPGPVLFRQVRVGRGARPFTMLKFRTMRSDADPAVHQQYVKGFIAAGASASGEKQVFKLTNDTRVTPVGRLLRRTSLDELPQLWNVARGEMSLVGPRPPLYYELEQYRPWHRRRVLECKPGMTGLWQVKGRSQTTFDQMVRMDLRYARERSLWVDLKILLATPRAVITGKGAV